jgi:hypothetical protein
MASAQRDPVRGSIRDQKDDSLLAIKDWLIRNPPVARPESHSAPLHPAASERDISQEEVDDAPSIAAASQFPVDLGVDECDNQAETRSLNDPRVVRGDDVREGKLAVRGPLLRVLACAVLLLAVVVAITILFLSERQSDIFGAWNQLRDWSSYELHTVLPASDAGKVSERSDANTQGSASSAIRDGAQSSPATARSSDVQHQSDAMSEELGPVQRTIHDSWNRSREWFAYAFHTIFSKKNAGTISERSDAAVQSVVPPPTSDEIESASAGAKPSELGHQPDTMWEDLGFVQRAIHDSWYRSKEWLAYASRAIFTRKNAGTVSDSSKVAAQTVAPSTTSPDIATMTATQLAPASTTSASSEIQHQLDTISRDLDDLRRIVADLSTRQEQTIRDVATLQSAQQSMGQKLSSLPRSLIVGTSRKNVRHRLY